VTDWSPLGGNPAPGLCDHVWATGKFFEQSQHDAQQAQAELQALAAGSDEIRWTGLAASMTRQALGRLAGPHLDVFAQSHGLAASAMFTYAEGLETLQGIAQRLLAEANDLLTRRAAAAHQVEQAHGGVAAATARYDRAVAAVKTLTHQLHAATDPAVSADLTARLHAAQAELSAARAALEEAQAGHSTAARALQSIVDELARVRQHAAQVRDDAEGAGNRAAQKLHEAASEHVKQPNVLQRDIRAIIEVEKAGAVGPELESYLKFLEEAKDVLADVVNMVPGLNKTPLGKYALVAIIGIDIVIMAGHEMQRLGGRQPDHSFLDDLKSTAWDGVSMFTTVNKSQGLEGDLKRAIWYDDARHATGGWHEMVAASPKVSDELMRLFPGASPKSVFRVMTALEVVKHTDAVKNDTKDFIKVVRCALPQENGGHWSIHANDVDVIKTEFEDARDIYHLGEVIAK